MTLQYVALGVAALLCMFAFALLAGVVAWRFLRPRGRTSSIVLRGPSAADRLSDRIVAAAPPGARLEDLVDDYERRKVDQAEQLAELAADAKRFEAKLASLVGRVPNVP